MSKLHGAVTAVASVMLAACHDTAVVAPPAVSPDAIAGEYELVRIGSQPLPAQTFRTTVYGSHLSLGQGGRYSRTVTAQSCSPVACTDGTTSDQGTWLVLWDGSLYLDPEQGYSWPAPSIEADGKQVRFYITGDHALAEVYERR